jgi:hypothetical protein
MGKQTEKLSKALDKLGLAFDPDVPNIVIYGKMAERGYVWSSEGWKKIDGRLEIAYPVSVRLMGELEDIIALAEVAATSLRAAGLHIEQGAPTPNIRDNSRSWRIYITVE